MWRSLGGCFARVPLPQMPQASSRRSPPRARSAAEGTPALRSFGAAAVNCAALLQTRDFLRRHAEKLLQHRPRVLAQFRRPRDRLCKACESVLTGFPSIDIVSPSRCCAVTTMFRCRTCGSASARSTVFTGAAGMSASCKRSSHSADERRRNAASSSFQSASLFLETILVGQESRVVNELWESEHLAQRLPHLFGIRGDNNVDVVPACEGAISWNADVAAALGRRELRQR